MSLAASGQGIFHATGLSRLDRERTRLHVTFDRTIGSVTAGTEVEGVADGDDFYIRREGESGWLRVPDEEGDGTFSTGVADSLDYLAAVTGNAEYSGKESVRGAPARIYSATVDLQRVADRLPEKEQDEYREKISREGLPSKLPVKVAIDEQGRIVRMDYEATVQGSEVEIHIEIYDFGAKGDLSVPRRFEDG
jgi:hypothetical protein